jgi:hypothetical protein
MKKSKKIVSLLLSVLMIITALPLTAVNSFAEDTNTKTSGDYEYTVSEDGTAEITAYNGNVENVVIPSVLDGYAVTVIGDNAFDGNTFIKSIMIPDSIINISIFALDSCISLADVYVSAMNRVYTAQGGILFSKERSKLLFYPQGKMTKEYIIPTEVLIIGEWAFSFNTYLECIEIPNSVTSIEDAAFRFCTSLENISISDSITNMGWKPFLGTAYYDNETNWDNGLLYIGNYLVAAKSDIFGVVEIKQGTRRIESDTFSGATTDDIIGCTSLKGIIIPDGVTSIGDRAFLGCTSLTSIIIPQSVTNIDTEALGYKMDNDGPNKVDGFTIYGYTGSEAERYAKDNEFTFVTIGGAPTVTFPDIANEAWYYNAIAFNVNKGYLKGYGNGYFGPADNIQRQDFVVLLSRIAGVDLSEYEGQNGDFADVPMNDYYSAAVAWAKDNNILSGYANGKFGVGDPITREQACKIFYNYCNGSVDGNTSAILANYPDGDAVSDWAKTAVAWAAENHIVGGNGILNPAGNANRAEMAQIIMNMSNNNIL